MNWLRKWKSFFKDSNRTTEDLLFKCAIESRGATYIKGSERYLSLRDVETLDPLIPVTKLQNYLLKQQQFFRYYDDYIETLHELDIPLNKNNLFPKDITIAHDKAVDTLNEIKLEIESKAFEKRYKTLQTLECTIQGYIFIVPRKANELIQEGRALDHCVGGSRYIERHAEGKSTIVFVRQENEPNVPYYTLEIRNNEIVQLYGKKNSRPSDDIRNATHEWLTTISKLSRKEQNVA
ncbi:PcfJ domain-containing protein [Enterococcus sp. 5H]|uniref:PcfJ domain-containing protein n=1 Tax=Enterococcus sp. 5H TaxID=1229490 RepID=UPI0023039AAC|nr:PcfJ domain-containing protein [Enterococcus sp. 5H]